MKFGKQLEISANPDWRNHYVQYKRLKRLIKRVAFEVERHSNKPKTKNKKKSSSSRASDPLVAVQIDEMHPLLPDVPTLQTQFSGLHDIQAAKDEFWQVTNENLAIVNDFFNQKIISLSKSIKEFEEDMLDEQQTHGHVHARPHSLSTSQCTVIHPLIVGGLIRTIVVDHGFAALQEIYDTLVDLRTFVQINHSGFRKIVKKVCSMTFSDPHPDICMTV